MKPIILTLALLLSIDCFGQQEIIEKQKEVRKKLSDFLLDQPEMLSRLPDSGKLYSFFFQIGVNKNQSDEATITSLMVSDSIAHRIYPDQSFLRNIPFELFMRERDKAVFIIPVVLDVVSSKGEMNENRTFRRVEPFVLLAPKEQDHNLEDYIYFRPFVLWIDKQVYY